VQLFLFWHKMDWHNHREKKSKQ